MGKSKGERKIITGSLLLFTSLGINRKKSIHLLVLTAYKTHKRYGG